MPYADYQVHLAANRARQKTPEGKAAHGRANLAYRRRNKEKLAAHNAVAKAIGRGKLVPWPCCEIPTCNDKPEAHHPHYGSPLLITWLCPAHHKAAHALLKE
jgi:hypothetical protein